MRIGIDISQIVYQGTGVARFTNGLVNAILDSDKKNQWIFFFSSLRNHLDQKLRTKIINRNHRLINYKLPPSLLSFMWNRLHLLNAEHITGPVDWFITSDWTEPPGKVNKATIVHDLAFMRYPETVDPLIRKTQKLRLKWVKKESAVIFADSQATKDDIIDLLKIDKKKIFINYPGVDINENKNNPAGILDEYRLNKPFILTVGKLEPRKNILRLIQAFNSLRTDSVDLIIVGDKGWGETASQDAIAKKNVRFLGYVPDDKLSVLYSKCLFFIYPSIWEGFGYPVIEAMKHGAAVATSNTSSLKEIGRDSALLFDPQSEKSIQQALEKLITDNELRNGLKQKGLMNATRFTWKNYYNKLINTLNSVYQTSAV